MTEPATSFTDTRKLEVVVLGGGFAGLTFCQHLEHPRYHVTLVDRQNHHLFQPLLYQVATGGLSAPEIAQPLRSILADHKNVTTLMDEVKEIDLEGKEVITQEHTLPYDYLIIALGAKTGYFGRNDWAPFTLGLKSLDEALTLRRRVLEAFERAEACNDPVAIKRLLTMVIVGGGPTGVELAGSLAELSRVVFQHDFRRIDPSKTEVHLIEAGSKLLSMFPGDLPEYTVERLKKMGVTVHLDTRVEQVGQGFVVAGGQRIDSEIVIWAAGVEASGVTRTLAGVPLDKCGRIHVLPDLSLPGHREVFAAGDLVNMVDAKGQRVPGVSPAAMQMGTHIARILNSGDSDRPAFTYWDKGSMATIGRSAAVADFAGMQFRGFIAWMMWLFVHLVFLVGMRNRLTVFMQWMWSYFTWKRGARIIIGHEE
ncbi:MAG TPA: NAD(P)/FAD-dependent oxidoreductase [Prosthecobacter sp.]|nr:NAD(P)/FAD-dependent oxidoreductase [Prosthecobacter sp.]